MREVETGYHTNPGRRYGTLNQDSFLAYRIPGETESWILAVFDGHGLVGESAAQTAALTIKSAFSTGVDGWVAKVEDFLQDPQASMTRLFKVAHDAICEDYKNLPGTYHYVKGKEYRLNWEGDVAVYRSSRTDKRDVEYGCTATVAVYCNNRVVCGNAGDSRAFILKQTYIQTDGSDIMCVRRFSAQEVTEVHTPGNPGEVLRLAATGRVTITAEDYVRPIHERWIAHQMAFSRALGHRHLEAFGIIPTPFVKTIELTSDDFAIVLTTDGVTDALTDDNIIKIVHSAPSAQKASYNLVEDALKICTLDDEADNATAVAHIASSDLLICQGPDL